MPRHNLTISCSTAALLFICLLSLTMPRFANEEPKLQIPNQKSIINKEKLQLALAARQAHQLRQPTSVLKMQNHLEISLQLMDNYEANKPLTLRALITSSRDLEQLDFKWEGSSPLNIVKGLSNGYLRDIKSGISQEVFLTLQSPEGDSSLRIFFNVNHQEDQVILGQIGQLLLSKELANTNSAQNKLMLKSSQQIPAGLKVIY